MKIRPFTSLVTFVLFGFFLFSCGQTSIKDDGMDTKNIEEASGGSSDTTAPAVSSLSPADSATSIAINSTVAVTFSEAMDTTTVTTNTSSTSCSGTFQLSTDSFSTCIQMSSAPSTSSDKRTFTVTPASNLSNSTNYKVRIATDAKDSAGNALSSQYTMSNGFTTANTFSVSSTSPVDGATSVSRTGTITITFSDSVALKNSSGSSTVAWTTSATSEGSCSSVYDSKSVHISRDNFSTCHPNNGSVSGSTVTLTIKGTLAASTSYEVKVLKTSLDGTATTQSTSDTAISADYSFSFTTGN